MQEQIIIESRASEYESDEERKKGQLVEVFSKAASMLGETVAKCTLSFRLPISLSLSHSLFLVLSLFSSRSLSYTLSSPSFFLSFFITLILTCTALNYNLFLHSL